MRTCHEDRLTEEMGLENTSYLFCIKEREIRFERKLNDVVGSIRGLELNLSRRNLSGKELRLLWYDDRNFELYYQKKEDRNSIHSDKKESECLRIFRINLLNCWTVGF